MSALLGGLHFLTHAGMSWVVAGLAPRPPRDRLLIVLGGLLLDLDGLGILWSESAYTALHRAAGHGLLFAVILVAAAGWLAERPWPTAALVAITFHLHVALDVVGTGGLPIRYLWPLSDHAWSYAGHWVLASWQNAVVMTLTLLAVLATASRARRRARGGAGWPG